MHHDPETINRVLELLRRYDWDVGARKLQEEIQHAPRPEDQEAVRYFAAWLAAEGGRYDEAEQQFGEVARRPLLGGWAIYGQAFVQFRRGGDFRQQQTPKLLAQAEAHEAAQPDRLLKAAIAHLRGSLAYHEGQSETALAELEQAWPLMGKDHFGSGRILDTFGMVYADLDNFGAASKFYEAAIKAKERHGDQLGLALTYGNLGRLYLSWEILDRAEEFFMKDLRIAEQRTHDEHGKTQMHNQLGQVALARGEEQASAGNPGAAQKHWTTAAAWLDECIRAAESQGWRIIAGFARKDRALLNLARNHADLAVVEEDIRQAEDTFEAFGFREGLAHVWRAKAMLRRQQADGQDEAVRLLRLARAHFESKKEKPELARTDWEIARTLQLRRAPRPGVVAAYLDALASAEASRRVGIVQRIEKELREIDAEAMALHVYRRVRGRTLKEDTTSLVTGRRTTATVLFFDLQGSTPYARENDPAAVMLTLNQLMSHLAGALRHYDAQISGYQGDGFLALFEGDLHARRAVSAGLALFHELEQFNRPSRILELRPLVGRVGVATGEVVFANVGTYDKMDFTAIGTTTNLGARLEKAAEPGYPCISRTSHEAVGDHFRYRDAKGRNADCKGLEDQQVWDVTGPA